MATAPHRPSLLAGVAWVLGLRMLDRVAGFISMLVLARLLLPEHFGIVSLGWTVVALIDLLAALGLDTILIQSPTVTRDHYDTAWTIQCGLGIFCTLLLMAAAIPAVWFFREPRIGPIICALSMAILLQGARNIRLVDFRREMRFDKEFIFMGVRRLSGVAITIPAAIILRDQWALVAGTVISAAVGLVLSYVMLPYRPRLTLILKGELLGKANWLMASNFIMFVRGRASDFVLGRINGPATVGAYNLAAELSAIVSTELVAPVNRVALSDFSLQGTREQVVWRLDQLTGLLAIVLMPLGVGLSITASLMVPLLFGPTWVHTIPTLQILALAWLVAGLGSNFGVALLSLGRFSRDTIIHFWGAVLLLPLLVVGALAAGATGAAIAVLVANTMTVLVALLYMQGDIGYGLMRFLKSILYPVIAAAVMYGVVNQFMVAQAQWLHDRSLQVQLVAAVTMGAVTYLTVLGALWGLRGFPDGPERSTVNIVDRLIGDVIKRLTVDRVSIKD